MGRKFDFFRVLGMTFLVLLISGVGFASITTNQLTSTGSSTIEGDLDIYGAYNGTKYVVNDDEEIWKPATCVVDADGYGDYTDIQSCISDNTYVVVKEGTYTLTTPLYFVGNNNITLEGLGDSTILTIGNSADINVINVTNSNHVKIKNMRIEGNGVNQGADVDCVELDNSDYNLVEGVTLMNCAGYGIAMEYSDYNTIQNSYIYNATARDNYGLGIVIRYSKNNLVTHNIIEESINRDGIGTTECNGTVITDNIVVNGNLYGISVFNSTDSIISNNYVTGYNSGGIISDQHSEKTKIHSNVIKDSGSIGIRAYHNYDGTSITDNIVDGSSVGISVWVVRNGTVSDNEIFNNGDKGIELNSTKTSKISGNMIYSNTNYGIYENSDCDYNFYSDNYVRGHSTDFSLSGTGFNAFGNFDGSSTYFDGDIDLSDNDNDIILGNNVGRIESYDSGGSNVRSLVWYDSSDNLVLRGRDTGVKIQQGVVDKCIINSTGTFFDNNVNLLGNNLFNVNAFGVGTTSITGEVHIKGSETDVFIETGSSQEATLKLTEGGTVAGSYYRYEGSDNTWYLGGSVGGDALKGWRDNKHITVFGNLTIGDGTSFSGITMTSPDGSEFCCSVANDGTFSCSSGDC